MSGNFPTPTRDPRVNPQPGDVTKVVSIVRKVLAVNKRNVHYEIEHSGKKSWMTLKLWRAVHKKAANATVLHVAGEELRD